MIKKIKIIRSKFFLALVLFSIISCAKKTTTYRIVDVTMIEDRDGREHLFDRDLVEGKAIWCESHKQYELIEVKRLHNQASLIKAHAND